MCTVMCIYDMWKDLGLPCVCYIYMMCISVFHNNNYYNTKSSHFIADIAD